MQNGERHVLGRRWKYPGLLVQCDFLSSLHLCQYYMDDMRGPGCTLGYRMTRDPLKCSIYGCNSLVVHPL
jgi:hypothetical protein